MSKQNNYTGSTPLQPGFSWRESANVLLERIRSNTCFSITASGIHDLVALSFASRDTHEVQEQQKMAATCSFLRSSELLSEVESNELQTFCRGTNISSATIWRCLREYTAKKPEERGHFREFVMKFSSWYAGIEEGNSKTNRSNTIPLSNQENVRPNTNLQSNQPRYPNKKEQRHNFIPLKSGLKYPLIPGFCWSWCRTGTVKYRSFASVAMYS